MHIGRTRIEYGYMSKKKKKKTKPMTYAQQFASAGGKARAKMLSPARRQEIGAAAIAARWARVKKNKCGA